MTTERSTTEVKAPRHNGGPNEGGRPSLETAVREARGALEGMSRSMPELARASRGAVDDALRAIESGSDERLTAGMTFSAGLMIGLLVGGAPRLLIGLALLPLAAMGLTLADRRGGPRKAAAG